ncbi:hypothetical protein B0H17DRAFT_1145541 [Mycena rosella]|uniref:Uncharacterized protein n=1 Tax=Mycena rosella TaxID=1033263 RepID=A0AAD7G1Q1_MYCRO|nr:hypothetical protein B0H17DRAFT_1145541 [Mycena rosella]
MGANSGVFHSENIHELTRYYWICLGCTCKGWDWVNLVAGIAAVTYGIADSGYIGGSSGPPPAAGQNRESVTGIQAGYHQGLKAGVARVERAPEVPESRRIGGDRVRAVVAKQDKDANPSASAGTMNFRSTALREARKSTAFSKNARALEFELMKSTIQKGRAVETECLLIKSTGCEKSYVL